MCSPSIAIPLITIASSAIGFIGQNSAAEAQQRQIEAGLGAQNAAFTDQRQDIQDAAETDISDRVRQAQIERGRLRVAQGESGLSGATFDRLERDIEFQAGTDISRIQTNASKRTRATRHEQRAATHRSRTNSLQIRRPSLIGTGLQIAGAGVELHSAINTQES